MYILLLCLYLKIVETFVITRYSWTTTLGITTIHSPHDIFVGVHSFSHNKNRWWPAFVADQPLVWILQHFPLTELIDRSLHLLWNTCVGLNSSRSKESLDHMGCLVCGEYLFVSLPQHNQQNTILLITVVFYPLQIYDKNFFSQKFRKISQVHIRKKFQVLLSTRFQKQKQW